jgi:hypothetical protein
MAGRRVVVDVEELGPAALTTCPGCGAALSSVKRAELRPIAHILFRCRPGQHPRAFEARCGACGRVLILYETGSGLALVPGDQGELLRRVSELDRQDLSERKQRARDE